MTGLAGVRSGDHESLAPARQPHDVTRTSRPVYTGRPRAARPSAHGPDFHPQGPATARDGLPDSVLNTPDRSPIIAKTGIPGLYVNCGWGTGGFKATPGSAHVFAWTIARDEPHPINAPFTIERFRDGYLIDEAAAAAVAH